jgi:hypothetical protein
MSDAARAAMGTARTRHINRIHLRIMLLLTVLPAVVHDPARHDAVLRATLTTKKEIFQFMNGYAA